MGRLRASLSDGFAAMAPRSVNRTDTAKPASVVAGGLSFVLEREGGAPGHVYVTHWMHPSYLVGKTACGRSNDAVIASSKIDFVTCRHCLAQMRGVWGIKVPRVS